MDCIENVVYMRVRVCVCALPGKETFLIFFQIKVHQCEIFFPPFFLFCFIMDLGYCLPTFSAWSFPLGPRGTPAAPQWAVLCRACAAWGRYGVATVMLLVGGDTTSLAPTEGKRMSMDLRLLGIVLMLNWYWRQKSNNFWTLCKNT